MKNNQPNKKWWLNEDGTYRVFPHIPIPPRGTKKGHKVFGVVTNGRDTELPFWDGSAMFLIDERDIRPDWKNEPCINYRKVIPDVFREEQIPYEYVQRFVQDVELVAAGVVPVDAPSASQVCWDECGS